MIEILADLPPGIVGVRASGKVTAEDYESVLIPAVESAVQEHGKVRVLYIMDAAVTDFSLGAMWDDARVGFQHLQDFEKVAVVPDSILVKGTLQALHFLMPRLLRVFAMDHESQAREWIVA